MEHLSVSDFLTERGQFNPARLEAKWAHLRACSECRELAATYQFLAESLAEHPVARRHLDSEELCRFALGPDTLDADTHERCRDHVEACAECSDEVELVRAAVRESRENVVTFRPAPKRIQPLFAKAGALGLAATFAILLAGVVVVGRFWSAQPKEYRLAGLEVQAARVVQTAHPVFVESTRIQEQGMLALQSPIVTFGDGFSVDSGAGLIVGVGSVPAPLVIDENTDKHNL